MEIVVETGCFGPQQFFSIVGNLQGQHRRRHVEQEHKVAPFLAGSDDAE